MRTKEIKFNGLALKKFIVDSNLTNIEVAKHINVNNQQITNYIKGHNQPDLSTFCELCDLLNVGPYELINHTFKSPSITIAAEPQESYGNPYREKYYDCMEENILLEKKLLEYERMYPDLGSKAS